MKISEEALVYMPSEPFMSYRAERYLRTDAEPI